MVFTFTRPRALTIKGTQRFAQEYHLCSILQEVCLLVRDSSTTTEFSLKY